MHTLNSVPLKKILLLVIGVLACRHPLYAAPTDLTDAPLAVANQTKSNVIFTIDNSAGNDVDSLFPNFNGMYYETNVPSSTTSTTNLNGLWNIFPNMPGRPVDFLMGSPYSGNPDPNSWRALYFGYNAIYYNPSITYKPWMGTDQSGAAFSNAVPTAIKLNPWYTSSATYDITATVNFTASTLLNSAGSACFDTPRCSGRRTYTSSILPATYYLWNDANQNGAMDAGEGVRYAIVPGTTIYPSGRNYAGEIQNFANWFQYYRTPYLAAKAAMGVSASIMNGTKSGLVDLIALKSPVVDMSIAANLTSFRDQMYGLNLTGPMSNGPAYRQPLHERMQFVWNYLNRSSGSSPPPPIDAACQQNFNVIVSPGYTNEESPWKNDYTGNTPVSISPANYDGALGVPFADTFSDTLADWSAYYYDQRLRTDLASGKVPLPPNTRETNRNLHMTTFALSPGATPVTSANNPGTPLADPQTANLYPPNNTPITWPRIDFVAQSTVDDLWHAAVNGRGTFVNSANIADGLSAIVDDIVGRTGSSSAVAVANAHITSTDNASFATSYNSGTWTGNLNAFPIDLVTGLPDESHPLWNSSAQDQLDTRTATNRLIASYSGSAGVQFQPNSGTTATKLTSAQQTSLNTAGKTDAAQVIAYLRGDGANEATLYRPRAHLLGDIVDAEPVYLGPPAANYTDAGYMTGTSPFKTANSARPTTIFQGANDGMLHAFNAATGDERWAYIPSFVIPKLNGLTKTSGFAHRYFVDGTPVAGDVDMQNTSGANGNSNDWRTILVGGLGKGGAGFYALDVTNPVMANESALASKVLWEFPNASTSTTYKVNVGYSFGKPVIVKTASAGWVVLVTSGYNNGDDTGGDGKGYLFVLNPSNGNVIKTISTGVGTNTSPSGLAQIAAYVENADVDNTTDFVYGGDLLGNVWRFDLTGSINSWGVARLATLTDASSNPQPVTTAPELARISTPSGFKRMVYVGTGKYLGTSDVPAGTATQSMYGLVDNGAATPLISPLRSNLQAQSYQTNTTTARTASTNIVDYATKKGWYIDMTLPGERINTDPALGNSVLAFVTNIPSSDQCVPGGTSWLHFLDFRTGGKIDDPTAYSSTYLGNSLGSRPVLIQLPSGAIKAIVRQSDASTSVVGAPTDTPISGIRRVNWREIPVN